MLTVFSSSLVVGYAWQEQAKHETTWRQQSTHG